MDYALNNVLDLLQPFDPVGLAKVRIGGGADGGYVMLDRFRPGQSLFSYGVGPDVSFDIAMAERGLRVFMYDHTVAASPTPDPRCVFHREGVGPRHDPSLPCDTIAAHLALHAPTGNDLLLKMDVEAAEWHAILETDDAVLTRFEQIVMELHSLESLAHKGGRWLRGEMLSKLSRHFCLFHVHSNNTQDLCTVDGLPVTNLLEVSYARRDLCQFVPSRTLFPTRLDLPCNPARPEHRLWFYPFLPGSVAMARS